jgi:predicted RNA binding protein YcfA (HicA-like mRNA interferase family)
MPKLYSSREIERILENNGFVFVSQKGSHGKYRKNDRVVILPMNRKQIPMGTFGSILRQAGLTKKDFG